MLDAQELAKKLHDALSHTTDKAGLPTGISDNTTAYAKGVVSALKAAIVSNLPGTINGVTAPGAPLSAGSAIGGLMVITPGPMLAQTISAFPPGSSAQLALENAAIITYIGTGLIAFGAGNITGSCTNTPLSPGPLAAGAGSGGKITILNGPGAYAAVSAALGPLGPAALAHYSALINYILDKAEVTYPTGTVQGICPPAGGPLGGGFAAGGQIA